MGGAGVGRSREDKLQEDLVLWQCLKMTEKRNMDTEQQQPPTGHLALVSSLHTILCWGQIKLPEAQILSTPKLRNYPKVPLCLQIKTSPLSIQDFPCSDSSQFLLPLLFLPSDTTFIKPPQPLSRKLLFLPLDNCETHTSICFQPWYLSTMWRQLHTSYLL